MDPRVGLSRPAEEELDVGQAFGAANPDHDVAESLGRVRDRPQLGRRGRRVAGRRAGTGPGDPGPQDRPRAVAGLGEPPRLVEAADRRGDLASCQLQLTEGELQIRGLLAVVRLAQEGRRLLELPLRGVRLPQLDERHRLLDRELGQAAGVLQLLQDPEGVAVRSQRRPITDLVLVQESMLPWATASAFLKSIARLRSSDSRKDFIASGHRPSEVWRKPMLWVERTTPPLSPIYGASAPGSSRRARYAIKCRKHMYPTLSALWAICRCPPAAADAQRLEVGVAGGRVLAAGLVQGSEIGRDVGQALLVADPREQIPGRQQVPLRVFEAPGRDEDGAPVLQADRGPAPVADPGPDGRRLGVARERLGVLAQPLVGDAHRVQRLPGPARCRAGSSGQRLDQRIAKARRASPAGSCSGRAASRVVARSSSVTRRKVWLPRRSSPGALYPGEVNRASVSFG
jgi:hypothetical protein